MEGNNVYNALMNGIILSPNILPVELTFDDYQQYLQWNQLPSCEANERLKRSHILNYLSLCGDNSCNDDVKATYCLTNNDFPNQGDYLFSFLSSQMPFNCDEESFHPLTENEIQKWQNYYSNIIICN